MACNSNYGLVHVTDWYSYRHVPVLNSVTQEALNQSILIWSLAHIARDPGEQIAKPAYMAGFFSERRWKSNKQGTFEGSSRCSNLFLGGKQNEDNQTL